MIPRTAYDWEITVFSPDGRLFQVEYAREAVKRGTTTVGIKFKNGIALIVDKRITSRLIEPNSIEKIFKIDEHIGCATSGLVADARALVERARLEAQINRLTYEQPIQIKALVKKICDFKQTYTQYGGVRPFGTALLIGGVDDSGAHLFATDPSGAMMEYKATAEGEGRDAAIEYFEKNYEEGLSRDDAIILGLKALIYATEKKLEKRAVEVGIVDEQRKFRILTDDETEKYFEKAKGE
ncbi:MAG TPA: archaeal proteasome endopeptidase complex subunit alpha [Thermoplasmatales archaeon]|nr:archaeal proteasome endopeptidase complex subunit alpha [Thermoplasmatales archaeon]